MRHFRGVIGSGSRRFRTALDAVEATERAVKNGDHPKSIGSEMARVVSNVGWQWCSGIVQYNVVPLVVREVG